MTVIHSYDQRGGFPGNRAQHSFSSFGPSRRPRGSTLQLRRVQYGPWEGLCSASPRATATQGPSVVINLHSTWEGAFHGEGRPGVSRRGDPGGHGTSSHQCHCPHRSPGRPTNDESSPSEALGCRRAPVSVGALNGIWHLHVQIGSYLTLNPFIWVSSGTLTPNTD